MSDLLRHVFRRRDSLRTPWRLLLFVTIFGMVLIAEFVIIVLYLEFFDSHFLAMVKAYRHAHTRIGPGFVLVQEIPTIIAYFAALSGLARIERRRIRDYFLDGPGLRHMMLGFFWGFALLNVLIAILWLDGKITVSLADHGTLSILRHGAVWLIACLCIAFAEENLFRGFLLFTLERAIRFWPAAILLAIGFGLAHGENPGETPIGELFAGLYALVICLSIYYTRSLWWAIGYHAAWDWSESYLYGTADSGVVSSGRLLTSVPHGNVYLSGGPTGPEGSLFAIVAIVVTALVIRLTLRNSLARATEFCLPENQPLV